MKRANLIAACLVIMVLFINAFIAYSVEKVLNPPTVIAILPEKVRVSKLLRIVDKEAGVVCYILQNDTANFYSGLQCIRIGPYFTKEFQEGKIEDNREERYSEVGK